MYLNSWHDGDAGDVIEIPISQYHCLCGTNWNECQSNQNCWDQISTTYEPHDSQRGAVGSDFGAQRPFHLIFGAQRPFCRNTKGLCRWEIPNRSRFQCEHISRRVVKTEMLGIKHFLDFTLFMSMRSWLVPIYELVNEYVIWIHSKSAKEVWLESYRRKKA